MMKTQSLPAIGTRFVPFVCSLTLLAVSAYAQNVNVFFVSKGEAFVQSGSAAPSTATAYSFEARVDADTNTTSTATIQGNPPNGPLNNLSRGGPFEALEFESEFADKTGLDAAFPNGVYRFVISNSADGQKTIDLTFPGPDAYPPIPRISNYDALVAAKNPSLPLNIEWDAIPGGTTNDFIQVEILEGAVGADGMTVFRSPDPNRPDALNATMTSLTVPGRTLQENRAYTVEILFSKAVDFQPYDQAMFGDDPGGAAVFGRITLAQFGTTNATDVSMYSLLKAKVHSQTNQSSVQPVAGTPFFFGAQADGATGGSVTAATIQDIATPGPVNSLANNGGQEWEFEAGFATEAALHTAHPDGQYQLITTGTNDGVRNVTIDLSAGSGGLPIPPRVTNFDAAQTIDPNQDFTLTWTAFTGGRADSFVMLFVEDDSGQNSVDVVETGFWGLPGMLPDTATSFVIPAGRLQPGRTYQVELIFVDVASATTTGYEAGVPVPGIGGYAGFTTLNIRTLAPPAPVFTNSTILSGNILQVDLQTLPGQSYTIEGSENLTNWTTLLVTNQVAGPTVRIQDPTSLGTRSNYFYRAQTGAASGSGGGNAVWDVAFYPALDLTQCNGGNATTFSSQAVSVAGNGGFSETWSPATPLITVAGTLVGNNFSANLNCSGGAQTGTITAAQNNGFFIGTYSFENSGAAVIVPQSDKISVQGRAVDQSSGNPIAGALVTTTIGGTATTDANGFFFLVTDEPVKNGVAFPYAIDVMKQDTHAGAGGVANWGDHPVGQLFELASLN